MADQESIRSRQEGWRKVVLRTWQDEKYKRSLIENPNKVLKEAGIPVDPGVNIVVVQNELNRVHLVLPLRPSGEVKAEHADAVSLSDYDAAIPF